MQDLSGSNEVVIILREGQTVGIVDGQPFLTSGAAVRYTLDTPVGKGSTSIIYRGTGPNGREVVVKQSQLAGVDVQQEYDVLAALWQESDRPAIPPAALFDDDQARTLLVMPLYKQPLFRQVWDALRSPHTTYQTLVDVEVTAAAAMLGYVRTIQGLHHIGYFCLDRKVKDFFFDSDADDAPVICIDWNVVERNASLTEEIQLLSRLWHELFVEWRGGARFDPLDEVEPREDDTSGQDASPDTLDADMDMGAWTAISHSPMVRNSQAISLGFRYILTEMLNPEKPLITYAEIEQALDSWIVLLTSDLGELPDKLEVSTFPNVLEMTTATWDAVKADLQWRRTRTSEALVARHAAMAELRHQLADKQRAYADLVAQSSPSEIMSRLENDIASQASRGRWWEWSHLRRWHYIAQGLEMHYTRRTETEVRDGLVKIGTILHDAPQRDNAVVLDDLLSETIPQLQSLAQNQEDALGRILPLLEAEIALRKEAKNYTSYNAAERPQALQNIEQLWHSVGDYLMPQDQPPDFLLSSIFNLDDARDYKERHLQLLNEIQTMLEGLPTAIRDNDIQGLMQTYEAVEATVMNAMRSQPTADPYHVLGSTIMVMREVAAFAAYYCPRLAYIPVQTVATEARSLFNRLPADDPTRSVPQIITTIASHLGLQQIRESGQQMHAVAHWNPDASVANLVAYLRRHRDFILDSEARSADILGTGRQIKDVLDAYDRLEKMIGVDLVQAVNNIRSLRARLSQQITDAVHFYEHIEQMTSPSELREHGARLQQEVVSLKEPIDQLVKEIKRLRQKGIPMPVGLEGIWDNVTEELRQHIDLLQSPQQQLTSLVDAAEQVYETLKAHEQEIHEKIQQQVTTLNAEIDASIDKKMKTWFEIKEPELQRLLDKKADAMQVDVEQKIGELASMAGQVDSHDAALKNLEMKLSNVRHQTEELQQAWVSYFMHLSDVSGSMNSKTAAHILDLAVNAIFASPGKVLDLPAYQKFRQQAENLADQAKFAEGNRKRLDEILGYAESKLVNDSTSTERG